MTSRPRTPRRRPEPCRPMRFGEALAPVIGRLQSCRPTPRSLRSARNLRNAGPPFGLKRFPQWSPCSPGPPELAKYVVEHAGRVPLAFDEAVRYEPGAIRA